MNAFRQDIVRLSGLALLMVSACATTPDAPVAATASGPAELTAEMRAERDAIGRADPLTQATYWSQAYEANPRDFETISQFARALRTIGSHDRALEVLSDGLTHYPDNVELLTIAARALITLQNFQGAEQTWQRITSLDPRNADAWAGLGLTYDQTGRHSAAQRAYQRALDIAPERPSTLSNFGMSLVLSGDPAGGEVLLRRALEMPGASPVVRQNLALVVGLQGRFDEMREIGGEDLPDELANANVDVIRRMLTPTRSYESVAGEDAPQ